MYQSQRASILFTVSILAPHSLPRKIRKSLHLYCLLYCITSLTSSPEHTHTHTLTQTLSKYSQSSLFVNFILVNSPTCWNLFVTPQNQNLSPLLGIPVVWVCLIQGTPTPLPRKEGCPLSPFPLSGFSPSSSSLVAGTPCHLGRGQQGTSGLH